MRSCSAASATGATAAAMAAMPGRFSMPARRRRSRSSPTSTGRSRARLEATRKPVPGGPYTLWPLATSRSAPRSATSTGRRPTVWQASTSSSAPALVGQRGRLGPGWMVPTSWLACWRQTSRVSSRTAAPLGGVDLAGVVDPDLGDLEPLAGQGPGRGQHRGVLDRRDDQVAAAPGCPGQPGHGQVGRLGAAGGEHQLVGAASTAAASCSRDRSSSSRACRARPYSRDGSPKPSRASTSAARARGAAGWWRRHQGTSRQRRAWQ